MSIEPSVFGRYQLLEPIATGGMAEVFRARLVAAAGTEKVLCIKRILPRLSQSRDFVDLFVKEAKIALTFNHSNITQVFDFGEVEGVYYLAMEYIAGQDLNTILRRLRSVAQKLDPPTCLFIASEVSKALQYAHSFADESGKAQQVVHRDVSPHNVLVSYNGQVKLADFGIAHAAAYQPEATGSSLPLRGKLRYIAPERVAGVDGGPRGDIYSLGVVLHEMLTGVIPFDADGDVSTLELVKSGLLEPPSQQNGEIDEEIDRLVMKAVAREPNDRYASAAEFQAALSSMLHRRWPDYTADRLAETQKDLFAWELSSSNGARGDNSRDRLLFQLSQAGIAVVDKDASTDELLQLGTVAIGHSADRPNASKEGGGKGLIMALGGGALLIVTVVAAVILSSSSGTTAALNPQDAGVGLSPPLSASTDHIAPKSLQRDPRSTDDETSVYASAENATTKDVGGGETNGASQRAAATDRGARASSLNGQVAYLNCNSWPWSVVHINGRRVRGNTPLFRVRVRPGHHRVRFDNPELGLSKEIDVTVAAGQTSTVAVSLHQ